MWMHEGVKWSVGRCGALCWCSTCVECMEVDVRAGGGVARADPLDAVVVSGEL